MAEIAHRFDFIHSVIFAPAATHAADICSG